MATYKAPLRDMQFVMYDLLQVDRMPDMRGWESAAPDLVSAVLEEAGKLCEEVLFPLNRSGDEEGCTYENGVVRTPKGFKEAYKAFTEGGWTGLACAEQYGGQELPHIVSTAVEEMICAANMSFGMYPGLSAGAYRAVAMHGSQELKDRYLPKLTSGEWSGTMCLTEPQCGTDLGLIRTKAIPADDGSFRITGSKIFLSAGEHDLAENIIHLVLARLPDAPPGTRGISLFVLPKFLLDAEGRPGKRNDVRCAGIEHKLGVHGSPTCTMVFGDDGGAIGWLIGQEDKGLNCMFTMMNNARLSVGIQGVAIAERATQHALAYARERRQGKAQNSKLGANGSGMSPIVMHPDVQRMLMTMKAQTAAARAICYMNAAAIDRARRESDATLRKHAGERAGLLTPLSKAYSTDIAATRLPRSACRCMAAWVSSRR